MEAVRIVRRPSALSAARLALAAFVVAWLFDLLELRSTVPIWLPFLIALGLEVHFFLGALRSASGRRAHDRLPQAADRERYGFEQEGDELLLVRRDDEELWIPYAGQAGDDVGALIDEARQRLDDEEDEEEAAPALPQRRRRSYRQLLAGLAVLAALGTLVWLVEARSGWSGLDGETRADAAARFSEEASRIAGHGVTIRCDEGGDFVGAVQHSDGVAEVGGRVAYLTPERCYELYRLAVKDETLGSRTGRALAVLAHEAWHLRGVRAEGKTECYALQSGVALGRRLGLSEGTARRLMRQQLAENALRRGAAVEYLVPAECRDGGELDLHPRSSQFP